MAYSYINYTGNGSTTQFSVPMPYIRKEHVYVYVNNVAQSFTWVNTTTVLLASAPANGAAVQVRRITPVLLPLVDFTDGSTFVAADLDVSNLQHLYIEQELDDASKQAVYVDQATALLTAGGQRITNVGAPLNGGDAANKTYVDNVITTGVPDGDKGDIIVLGSGTQWTIDTGVVGTTKLADSAVTSDKINPSAFTDSVGSTSTSTIATPNSVKTAYDLANAALPKSGGTVTGNVTFQQNITMSGTGFLDLPVGTTAQRPLVPAIGMIRFNTDIAQFEGYGSSWGVLGGGAVGGARNRIINGDMRIDQRNAGASVTPTTTANGWPVDRFFVAVSQNSKLTTQRNAGSVTPPAGFTNYLGVTSSSAYSIISSDYFSTQQNIEGYNTADLAWGTADAKTVTVSFWVRSSLTGTFGGVLRNSGLSRSYPFTYSINTANTWEQKAITIPGDTSGTWNTTNGIGISVIFGLGVGSANCGTAGTWAAANYASATGATSVVGTNGATFYITGVQLEPGTGATPFERRSYGQELALCYRYYETGYVFMQTYQIGATASGYQRPFAVIKRAVPTIAFSGALYGNASGINCNRVFVDSFNPFANTTATGSLYWEAAFTASAEL